MSFIKYAAPVAAALAGLASADSNSACSFSATQTVTAAGDVSTLAACSTISGDIAFGMGAVAGAQPTLMLSSVKEIDGSVSYEGDGEVQSFQAPMLEKISGELLLNNLTSLANVQLGAIQTTGDVAMTNCPVLSSVVTGPQYSEASSLNLGNTLLSELAGFGNLTKLGALTVAGNQLLADITMNIASVRSIDIGSNEEANQGLNVRFDNLTMAMDHITVQNATNVSFASLETVTNNIELIFNNFETFAAPNLTYAGGFVLNSNPELTNISLPNLVALNGTNGTFQIANNTKLTDITGFPKLTDCEHDVYFYGVFTNASISQFKKVAGAMNVRSTQDITDLCNEVNTLRQNQVILGKPECMGTDPNADGATAGSNSSSSGSGSGSGKKSAAAGPLAIPSLPVLSAGALAAVLSLMLSF